MSYLFVLQLISAVLAVFVFYIVEYWRDSKKGVHLSIMALSICIYIIGGLFEISSGSYESAYLAVMLEYLGMPFIVPNALLAIADFYNVRIGRNIRWTLFVLPVIACLLVLCGNPGNLFYNSTSYYPGPPVAQMRVVPGPFYYIYVSYLLVLFVFTLLIIINQIRQRRRRGVFREVILLVAVGLPIASYLMYLFNLDEHAIDYTPIVFAITSGLLAFAIRKLNFLQILPMARAVLIEEMTDPCIIVDMECGFLEANRAAKKMYPVLGSTEVGDKLTELPEFEDDYFVLRGANKDIPVVKASNGHYYHVSQTNVTQNGKALCTCIMLFDITETQKMIDTFREKATYDPLTQIYNRATFFQMAEMGFDSTAEKTGQAAVMMFDLDHFKVVNDTYGHQCGDMVLKTAVQRIQKRLRDTDVFGRYGGEEFCAFLTHITPENAMILAESLRNSIAAEAFSWEGVDFHVTVSIGVAGYGDDAYPSVEAMIADADKALYTAKGTGRNRAVMHG